MQPVQSDVFSFLFLQEVKKPTKQPKNYMKVIIFLLTVSSEPSVNLCQGSNGLGSKGVLFVFQVVAFFFFCLIKNWKISHHNIVSLHNNFVFLDLVLQVV